MARDLTNHNGTTIHLPAGTWWVWTHVARNPNGFVRTHATEVPQTGARKVAVPLPPWGDTGIEVTGDGPDYVYAVDELAAHELGWLNCEHPTGGTHRCAARGVYLRTSIDKARAELERELSPALQLVDGAEPIYYADPPWYGEAHRKPPSRVGFYVEVRPEYR